MRFYSVVFSIVFTILGMMWVAGCKEERTFNVIAVAETEPVASEEDAADDPCIWLHPEDRELSVVIGTDKNEEKGGLVVYDMKGEKIFKAEDPGLNNVDLRYGFPIDSGETADVVAASSRYDSTIALYIIYPEKRSLAKAEAREIKTLRGYGLCMYHSTESDKYYVFINDKQGRIEQWELVTSDSMKIDAKKVRDMKVPSKTEGCVADDEKAILYVGEEAGGIWKFSASPEDTAGGELIDTIKDGSLLKEDVEGLTLFYGNRGSGYIIASSQGDSSFVIYDRETPHKPVCKFIAYEPHESGRIADTDGIAVISSSIGSLFPEGLVVVQDGYNDNGEKRQNFKYIDWRDIMEFEGMNIESNNSFDPRKH